MNGEAFCEAGLASFTGAPSVQPCARDSRGRRLDALWWLKLLAVHALRVSVPGAARFALPPLAGAFVVVDEPKWTR